MLLHTLAWVIVVGEIASCYTRVFLEIFHKSHISSLFLQNFFYWLHFFLFLHKVHLSRTLYDVLENNFPWFCFLYLFFVIGIAFSPPARVELKGVTHNFRSAQQDRIKFPKVLMSRILLIFTWASPKASKILFTHQTANEKDVYSLQHIYLSLSLITCQFHFYTIFSTRQ